MSYIDIHTHILPGLDDGPADLGAAVELARGLVARGFRKVVATPHCFEGNPSPGTIMQRLVQLRDELSRLKIPLEVLPGAEHVLDPQMVRRVLAGELLTLNGGRYLLVELPMQQLLPPYVEQLIFELKIHNYYPVLAHPERVSVFQKDPASLIRLIHGGAVTQVNLASLVGLFGPETRRTALKLLSMDMVHLVATDAHSPGHRLAAVPDVVALLERKKKGMAGLLLKERPGMLLESRPLDLPAVPQSPARPRKGIFGRRRQRL